LIEQPGSVLRHVKRLPGRGMVVLMALLLLQLL
jgi:hypothetical protein